MIIRGLRGDVAFDLSLDVWKEFQSVERKRGFPSSSDGKASACNVGDLGSIPGLGRSPGEGNGYPLQYSGLESLMDRGVWATVHGVARSWTQLSDFHFTSGQVAE